MKQIKLLGKLFLLLIIVSCSKDDDNTNSTLPENIFGKWDLYQSIYKGETSNYQHTENCEKDGYLFTSEGNFKVIKYDSNCEIIPNAQGKYEKYNENTLKIIGTEGFDDVFWGYEINQDNSELRIIVPPINSSDEFTLIFKKNN
ncbi:lipocalin family protein [Aureivirga marina]|uniref:lipocalin family protein n=1 Tax=Aureivirga marina TaxID=1182451 RepID=UPI0018CA7219|nr:lipocalin family protein [Aureivirga marina]